MIPEKNMYSSTNEALELDKWLHSPDGENHPKEFEYRLELKKSLLSPPGDTLQEHLDHIGMSQAELAARLGRAKEKTNDLIKGRERLTIQTAKQLEKILGISASFWVNLEQSYRQELHEIERLEALEQHRCWLEKFPIQTLQHLGYLPTSEDNTTLIDGLLEFFAVASPKGWENIYMSKKQSTHFFPSLHGTPDPYALSVWLRIGERRVEKLTLANFDKKRLKHWLADIRSVVNLESSNFPADLQATCAEFGLAVIFMPNISNIAEVGCTRWYRDIPIIQMSEKWGLKKDFWRNFFHQIAHLLLHGKKEIFFENLEGIPRDEQKEQASDNFALKAIR